MSETAQSILAAAMTLSDGEREALTVRLIEMLPPLSESDELSDDDFAAEMLRRKKEMEDGTDPGIPWSELKDME